MADRLTMHKGYRGQNGKAYNSKHNQRESFQKNERTADNVYWDYTVGGWGGKADGTFSENEMGFYRKYFSRYIKQQNEKDRKSGHYGRMKTLQSYKEKHPPEETLLYFGKHGVDMDVFMDVAQEYHDWHMMRFWNPKKGGIQVLNRALHVDETTLHEQYRQVYMYLDKDGNWQVSQNKALELLGIERPDPTKPISRTNNAKMTYTKMCREMLFEIAREHGLELETVPLPKDEVGLSLKEYIEREKARAAAAKEQAAARETIQELQDDVAELQTEKESLSEELQELQDDKADAAEELERLRRTTSRELDAREQKRKEAMEQGYKDGFVAGARDGAQSALGQVNQMLRQRREEEELEQASADPEDDGFLIPPK